MFQIQTVADTAQLDIHVALNLFECNFLACVADGKVDLSKSADTDPALDRITCERFSATGIGKLHSIRSDGWGN